MITKAKIKESPSLQFLLIATLCVVSAVLFSGLGIFIAKGLYGFDLSNLANVTDSNSILGLKLVQLFSALGLFVVPPIVYAFLIAFDPIEQLSLKNIGNANNYLLVLLLMLVLVPILSWIVELNANVVFPDFLSDLEQQLRNAETNAMNLTKMFLTFDGLGSVLYVLFIVAVLPAFGEELLFRGVLQKTFIQLTKNPHWGIWITAFLFSALHMQFFGFLPRMLLGAVFGYLFLWSKSLWIPILGHFINNGIVVAAAYLYPETVNEMEDALFEDGTTNVMVALISLVMVLGVLWLFKRLNASSITMNISEKGIENEN